MGSELAEADELGVSDDVTEELPVADELGVPDCEGVGSELAEADELGVPAGDNTNGEPVPAPLVNGVKARVLLGVGDDVDDSVTDTLGAPPPVPSTTRRMR